MRVLRALVPVAAGCALLAIAPAAEAGQAFGGAKARYVADPGEVNNVMVTTANGAYTLRDTGSTVAPSGPAAWPSMSKRCAARWGEA